MNKILDLVLSCVHEIGYSDGWPLGLVALVQFIR